MSDSDPEASEAGEIPPEVRAKHRALVDRLRELAPVVVALSGGVDSTFLLAVAAGALGDRATAAIGVSPSVDRDDLQDARAFAVALGVPLREVPTSELEDPRYVANAGDRCFYCKRELYERILAGTADIEGRTVVDGNHAGDRGEHRPGLRANRQLGIASPMMDVGLAKTDIRLLSRELALPSWDKPEAACLASRVPVGTRVTADTLARIASAERVLKEAGLRKVRVRHEGAIARIETDPSEMGTVLELRAAIVAGIRGAGYHHVTLDLDGYTRGGGIDEHG